ncbi:hypothetical protein NEOLEDRAFT_1151187 [Neolentinus lepideus HHB14362 ss-1]|uniref:Uncharacterized protein n=1 Tax=Neolentinus lepideus HHB14362 ss-1 TaxID=1314782 RepID=A0A165P9T8_9AGAM|nr:hypothetical protein NEOLEDRAFT_1151187 [Neolentinus lepideus HHB14362 ss-1]
MSVQRSFHNPSVLLPAWYHPLPPPPLELGLGDLWLQTVEHEDYSHHLDNSCQEVYCELFLVRIDKYFVELWPKEPNNTTIFVNEDTHELHTLVYVPINTGIPDKFRVSPVVIVEKWVGWREWQDAPQWTRWIPGETKTFVNSCAAVAMLFGLLSTHDWNKSVSDVIWEWTTVISTVVEEQVEPPTKQLNSKLLQVTNV